MLENKFLNILTRFSDKPQKILKGADALPALRIHMPHLHKIMEDQFAHGGRLVAQTISGSLMFSRAGQGQDGNCSPRVLQLAPRMVFFTKLLPRC